MMNDKELTARRKAMKITAREMARRLKTPNSTYKNWENGISRIPGIVEVAIAGMEFKAANKITRGA
jgi:transcriptional regulator with XRE-family HTH domain